MRIEDMNKGEELKDVEYLQIKLDEDDLFSVGEFITYLDWRNRKNVIGTRLKFRGKNSKGNPCVVKIDLGETNLQYILDKLTKRTVLNRSRKKE